MNPFESFLVMLRLSLYGGVTMALPVILYQICSFVFPGLTSSQRRFVLAVLFGGFFLAIGGIAIAYLGVFPNIMPYLITFTPTDVDTQMRMGETVGQLLIALVGFAIAFQFPMLLLVLVYLRLVRPESLARHWRYWMVGIAFGSALFVPPDPFSLLFMTIPLWALYWLSIFLAYTIVRKRESKEAEPK
jgi:sec-independent protein translocase protein TatC